MTPTSEEWRPVVGYEGLYEVSDQGHVRSVDRLVPSGRSDGGYLRLRGKVLSPAREKDGREGVHLSAYGHVRAERIQNLVLTAFVGPRPVGCNALHNDGNPADSRLVNLRWGSQGDNLRDAVQHGTHAHAKKAGCPRGHALKAPNLVRSSLTKGKRECLACNRAQAADKYARRTGRSFDRVASSHEYYAQIMSG